MVHPAAFLAVGGLAVLSPLCDGLRGFGWPAVRRRFGAEIALKTCIPSNTSQKKSKKRRAKTFVGTGVYIRLLDLVSWLFGGAYAPTGGVNPVIGFGFVA